MTELSPSRPSPPSLRNPYRSLSRFAVRLVVLALFAPVAQLGWPAPAVADGGVALIDIASDPAAGLAYRRTASPRNAIFDAIKHEAQYTFMDIGRTPLKPHGAPGVALLDFDGDGDLDLYVTNGPGTPNSLFENRLVPDGTLTFVDVAEAVGAGLADQDSSGVCFGDTDNDGDPDLLVLGSGEPSRLLENRGGWFVDVTDGSGIGGGDRWSTSCSMADVDGDGLLDVAVGNSFSDWNQQLAIVAIPFAQNEADQLFLNRGGNRFEDVSASSGILDLAVVPPGASTITWALALVDLDADGDSDLLLADDQAAIPSAHYGGVDRGVLQLFENDGTGHFTNRTVAAGTDKIGHWMGLAFGDYDCDGLMDFFGSNLGDYMATLLPLPYALGDSTSRWFFQRPDGSFEDLAPAARGALNATPFGWGASTFDYDADGDLDIVFHGGLDVGPFVEASNPGVVLANPGCTGELTWDRDALPSVDHKRRTVQGVAVGDLDLDGFADVVTVSSADQPEPLPLVPFPASWGSVFDPPVAEAVQTFLPTGPGTFVWGGLDVADGTLTVEIAAPRGDVARNRAVTVEPVGTVGITTGGRANRSGIGAVVTVTPHRGVPATRPVLGGASYASQNALPQPFGLGAAKTATVEILWPGGTRNRLDEVRPGEHLRIPEIPCSIDGDWPSPAAYAACVRQALDELQAAGLIGPGERGRYLGSALRARAR